MNYIELGDRFKPSLIKVLLVGEAPPPNGNSYFYAVPERYILRKLSIDKDNSLPATIFNHYFGRRPKDSEEYRLFLGKLMSRGIFLTDIINAPLKIRNKDYSLNHNNIDTLVSPDNLDDLIRRIHNLPITNETEIIFLLARNNYKKRLMEYLKNKFPKDARCINWKAFRMDTRNSIP